MQLVLRSVLPQVASVRSPEGPVQLLQAQLLRLELLRLELLRDELL
ncbi:MAG: hypothetical protein R3C10_09960 [Pirellulales bacterium]